MLRIDEVYPHLVWPIFSIVGLLFLALINNLVWMDCSIIFSMNFMTVSLLSSDEFWHMKTMRIIWFLCFNVYPLSLSNRKQNHIAYWWRFEYRSRFCSGFLQSFLFLLDRHGFSIQDTVWSSNNDRTWTSTLYLPCLFQTLSKINQIVHCLGSNLWYESLLDLEALLFLVTVENTEEVSHLDWSQTCFGAKSG